MAKKRRKIRNSGLNGKPVFEGVLMKNQNKIAVVVRKSDGELQTIVKNAEANPDKLIKKIPFVRGIFILVQNILWTLEALELSADFFGNDTGKETFIDKILNRLFGKHTNMIVTAITACVSFVVCILMVSFFPMFLARFLERYIINNSVIHIIEFAASVIIMFAFLSFLLAFKEVRRMRKYHSAEHKVINCLERGRKLTYKNVMASSRYFGRCLSDYIVFCFFISIVLFVFVKIDNVGMRLLFRLLYLPLATGLFYEFYVLLNYLPDNTFTRILMAPVFFFELFSLASPDDEMIKTAISAVDAVFDWKEFLVINFPEKYSDSDFGIKPKKSAEEIEAESEAAKMDASIMAEITQIDEEIIKEQSVMRERKKKRRVSENEEHKENKEKKVKIKETKKADEPKEEEDNTKALEEEFEEAIGSLTEEFAPIDESQIGTYEEELPEEERFVIAHHEIQEEINDYEGEEYVSEDIVTYDFDEYQSEEKVESDMEKLSKTQPVSIDFDDDYGFDPEDEEVDVNTIQFEPVTEPILEEAARAKEEDEEEEGPLFNKNIESIPMPESLDNIVEVLPEGGIVSRVYNYEEEEIEKESDEEYDFDNIIDEHGHLTLKNTDAFNRKLDEEYDEIFKRLGLDSDD